MAGVPADTQGSTALKALATDKISTCILQSANLLHLLRNSAHSEVRRFLRALLLVGAWVLLENPNQLGCMFDRYLHPYSDPPSLCRQCSWTMWSRLSRVAFVLPFVFHLFSGCFWRFSLCL